MFAVSYFYPQEQKPSVSQTPLLELKTWKYTTPFSIGLCVITVAIYIALGI
jgi:SSS family solute:Na+ symporter